MSAWGVDGCKAGWLAITTEGNNYSYGVYPSFADLISNNSGFDTCLIDIPIGLSSVSAPRTIDQKMRKELAGRASTVFPVPCRKAVYADTHDEAKLANLEIEGKSVPIQSFCISPKIRELDVYVSQLPKSKIIEGHPEISFKYLNGGVVLQSTKSSKAGLEERLSILEKYNRKAPDIYCKVFQNTLRKHVSRDDIVDAICLSVSVELAKNCLSFLTDENFTDEKGIEIKIGYYDPIRDLN